MAKEVIKCCDTCPFLKQNFGKPNPAHNPTGIEWYSKENAQRVWEGISEGEPMICHSSDSQAHQYGGKTPIKKGMEKICLGAVHLAYLEVHEYEEALKKTPKATPHAVYKRYKKGRKHPLTLRGISEWVFMIATGRSGLFGGLKIPNAHTEKREIELQS